MPNHRLRILVVDDEPMVRSFVETALVGRGYVVEVAGSGEEAMAKFSTSAVDVVVTDLSMPGKDGVQTIIELRRVHPPVAIVAMSGVDKKEGLLRLATMFQADTAISKPFTIDELEEAVAEAWEKRFGSGS